MSRKPVIALLGKFPLAVVDAAYAIRGWHSATWLAAMYEMLSHVHDFEVHWVVFQKGERRRRVFERNGQFFHVLPAISLKYAQKTHFLHARWQMRRELQRIKPDLVHAWGTEDRFAACGADFKGKKILSMQGVLSACAERAPMPPFMQRQAAMEPKWLQQYDVVTSESDWGVECCRRMAPGVAYVRWEYAVRSDFLKATREAADTPICLFGGSDIALKDVDTLVKAFSDSRLAHVQLELAGVSPERRPHLPANIHALGGLPKEQLIDRLSKAWCLVMPSLADSSPNIVKEARVMGLPVITTTECGGKQYVEDGKSGFIMKPRDTEALIRSVLAVTKDRETALVMGQHGQEECRRLLSRETMMQGLYKLYNDLLAR